MDESGQPAEIGSTACGGKLKDTQGFPSAFYGGKRIYFCHQVCLRVFEQSPDLFMTGEIKRPKKDN